MKNSSVLQKSWFLCVNQLSACVFGIFLLLLVFITKEFYVSHIQTWLYMPRYDFMLLCAVFFQLFLVVKKLESHREFVVIIIFHLMAFVMEVFKVYKGSWIYPETAWLAIAGVPLFAGFMYSAVGSYLARVHKNFSISYSGYPRQVFTILLVLLIYMNFFTHHYIVDLRWPLILASVVLFLRTQLHFVLVKTQYKIPVLLVFITISLLIWIAENIATYSNVWLYPNQMKTWQLVSFAKITSWYLLMLLSFVLVMLLHQPNKQDNT